MSHVTRDIMVTQGHNYLGLSAEHELIGIWRDERANTLYLSIAENTKLSDSEEGLVYRDIYIAICGEVLPFEISNAFGRDLLPGDGRHQSMTAWYLPASKEKALAH